MGGYIFLARSVPPHKRLAYAEIFRQIAGRGGHFQTGKFRNVNKSIRIYEDSEGVLAGNPGIRRSREGDESPAKATGLAPFYACAQRVPCSEGSPYSPSTLNIRSSISWSKANWSRVISQRSSEPPSVLLISSWSL